MNKLYHNPISSNSIRATFGAYEFGMPTEFQLVDVMKGENKTPEYLAMNPMGKIPTLMSDDGPLWESAAMLYYWAQKHPEKNLLPKSPKEGADCMRWMFWNACHLDNAGGKVFAQKVLAPMGGRQPDESRIAEGTKEFERYAPVLNARLEASTWVCGNTFTIADICIAPTIQMATQAGLPMSNYRSIDAWMKRIAERPAWKKATQK